MFSLGFHQSVNAQSDHGLVSFSCLTNGTFNLAIGINYIKSVFISLESILKEHLKPKPLLGMKKLAKINIIHHWLGNDKKDSLHF